MTSDTKRMISPQPVVPPVPGAFYGLPGDGRCAAQGDGLWPGRRSPPGEVTPAGRGRAPECPPSHPSTMSRPLPDRRGSESASGTPVRLGGQGATRASTRLNDRACPPAQLALSWPPSAESDVRTCSRKRRSSIVSSPSGATSPPRCGARPSGSSAISPPSSPPRPPPATCPHSTSSPCEAATSEPPSRSQHRVADRTCRPRPRGEQPLLLHGWTTSENAFISLRKR